MALFKKMCKKAKEIQEAWVPIVGDMTINSDDKIYTVSYVTAMGKISENKYFIPDIEQLFDLIPYENPVLKISYLHNSFDEDEKYYRSFKNIDEYILAVIMKEEHNKVWNHEKELWVIYKWD